MRARLRFVDGAVEGHVGVLELDIRGHGHRRLERGRESQLPLPVQHAPGARAGDRAGQDQPPQVSILERVDPWHRLTQEREELHRVRLGPTEQRHGGLRASDLGLPGPDGLDRRLDAVGRVVGGGVKRNFSREAGLRGDGECFLVLAENFAVITAHGADVVHGQFDRQRVQYLAGRDRFSGGVVLEVRDAVDVLLQVHPGRGALQESAARVGEVGVGHQHQVGVEREDISAEVRADLERPARRFPRVQDESRDSLAPKTAPGEGDYVARFEVLHGGRLNLGEPDAPRGLNRVAQRGTLNVATVEKDAPVRVPPTLDGRSFPGLRLEQHSDVVFARFDVAQFPAQPARFRAAPAQVLAVDLHRGQARDDLVLLQLGGESTVLDQAFG